MPKLIVTLRSGEEKIVSATPGSSLMEALRGNGIDDIAAICGGCCSCGTCHVYIESAWLARLPPVSRDENDLLDNSSHREPNSRLSCQIPFDHSLEGLKLTVAPED
jgi:2Fe-2S ferredoxin